jgi:uncharacterized protein (TIGR03083 family)
MRAAASADIWLRALHDSSARLHNLVSGLSGEQLALPSCSKGWSIAQVLSHLGSAAEISTALVRRGIAGDTTGPRREQLLPVWRRWDSLPPAAQREAWQEADTRHLGLLDSLDPAQRGGIRVPYFSGLLDTAAYAGYRLSEQSVHAWDIEAALDPGAAIPSAEVDLLWERIDLIATRFRDGAVLARLGPRQVLVSLIGPTRRLTLDLDAELHLYAYEPMDPTGTVTGTAEAVLRLIYGRNRSDDAVRTSGTTTLEDLRRLFPGY